MIPPFCYALIGLALIGGLFVFAASLCRAAADPAQTIDQGESFGGEYDATRE